MYIGEVGKRCNLKVKLVRVHKFPNRFSYYGDDINLYIFEDENGNTLTWKTTNVLGLETEYQRPGVEWKDCKLDAARINDTMTIKATVKEHSDYKREQQTVITRVKVMTLEHATTKEELDAIKRKEQLETLQDGDFVWTRMPYKQYKEHYADCETLAGSYREADDNHNARIDVIIRNGRLKNSGVRGQRYHSYSFLVDGNPTHGFYAVSYDNAEKRCRKEYPEANTIEFNKQFF